MTGNDRLAQYCNRIALGAVPAPDFAGLQAIQAAHRQAIPFENLDIMLGKPIAIDSEAHNTSPSWIIFDSTFRHHYPMGPLLPIPLFLHSRAVQETVIKAKDLEELAAKTGLPEQNLSATLERFNEHAAHGHDPDFGRGASEYDRYYGDPRVSPNPTLAPIKKPPYFAMLLHTGDIGTKSEVYHERRSRRRL